MSTRARRQETVSVPFTCKAAGASAVFLAGSFNNWSESAAPMSRGENEIWSASLDLPPGRHEYKFLIDGQWSCSPDLLPDPTRVACIPNTFGTMNFAVDAGIEET